MRCLSLCFACASSPLVSCASQPFLRPSHGVSLLGLDVDFPATASSLAFLIEWLRDPGSRALSFVFKILEWHWAAHSFFTVTVETAIVYMLVRTLIRRIVRNVSFRPDVGSDSKRISGGVIHKIRVPGRSKGKRTFNGSQVDVCSRSHPSVFFAESSIVAIPCVGVTFLAFVCRLFETFVGRLLALPASV